MSDLVSKISASGLSAGVFLLWWPAHVTSQGGDALLMRGILWAAAFELLLLGFRPFERALHRAVRERHAAVLAPRSIGRALALAVVAAGVPVALLSGTHGSFVPPARAAAPKVIVKREIVRREVVVRRVRKVVRVPVPVAAAPATTAAAPAAPVRPPATAPAAAGAAKRTTAKKKTAAATPAAGTSADTKTDVPSSAATTTEPAATAATPQPSTSAATAPTTAVSATASAAPASASSGG